MAFQSAGSTAKCGDVLGSPSPDYLTYEDKLAAIEKELFGDEDHEKGSDLGENEGHDEDASDHESEDLDDEWHERWMERSNEASDEEDVDAHPPPHCPEFWCCSLHTDYREAEPSSGQK